MADSKMRVEKARAMASFVPTSWDPEKRTIDVIVSTGAAVRRYDWWNGGYYDEELVISEKAIRMGRLNNGAPVLNTHSQWDLGDQIGVVERSWVEGGNLMGTLRLSAREDIAGIVQDIIDGIIRNISVGYIVHVYETIENAGQKIPTKRAIDWEPTEVSFVPVPADAGAQSRSAQPQQLYDVEVRVIRQEPPVPPAAASGTPQEETRTMDENEKQPQGGAAATAPQDTQAVRNEATAAERTRTIEIRKAVKAAKLGEEMADDLIARGVTVEEARAQVIGKLAEQDAKAPTVSVRGVSVGRDEADTRRAAMENALILRANSSMERTMERSAVEAAREYRGLRLIDMARIAAEAAGVNTRGMSPMEIAGVAMNVTRSGLTTSDFPAILANVANNSLRQAYEAAPQTFRPFVREVSASDFKPIQRSQLGEAPKLEKVNEAGEFKKGSMGEAKETYELATYGKIVSLTRQTIINDDMDAFTRLPASFGVAAANLESDVVWAIFTANAAMADNIALFHANHGNLPTAAALSNAAIGAARAAMRKQKGIDKKTVLNVQPRYLIVPAALEDTALTLLNSGVVPEQAANVNRYAGLLQPIVEPRLDDASATAWYLAADPMQIDTIEIAYLDGQRGVYIETQEGFEVDGIQIKARLDMAAAPIDFRGLLKNAGA